MSRSDIGEQLRIMYPGEREAQINAAEFVEAVFDGERRHYNKWSVLCGAGGLAAATALGLEVGGVFHIESYDLDNVIGAFEAVGVFGALTGMPVNLLKASGAKKSREKTSTALSELRAEATTEGF